VVPGAARRIDLPALCPGDPIVSRHRRRALVLAVLAVVLAVAGLAELGRGTGVSLRRPMAREVVVLRSLSAGDRLTADLLGVVRVPARYVSAGAVTDPRVAVGRRVAVALPAGALLMQPELAPNMPVVTGRDVAVRLDDAAGLPAGRLAGARADVVLARPGRAASPAVVLSNVLVVAAGRSDGAAIATLRLPAAAVATVVSAEGQGLLRLVVRASPGGL
jgi:hypothetical protein